MEPSLLVLLHSILGGKKSKQLFWQKKKKKYIFGLVGRPILTNGKCSFCEANETRESNLTGE